MRLLRDKLILINGQRFTFRDLVLSYPRLSYRIWRIYASGKDSFTVRGVGVIVN